MSLDYSLILFFSFFFFFFLFFLYIGVQLCPLFSGDDDEGRGSTSLSSRFFGDHHNLCL
jgi:hypothetical protein